MYKDRFLRGALAIPVIHEVTVFLIDIFIKKIAITKSLRVRFVCRKRNNKISRNLLEKNTKWLIQTSVPDNDKSLLWGDTYFANEINNVFYKIGQESEVLTRSGVICDSPKKPLINLVLRGLLPSHPINGAINILWIISHPSQISKYELKKFDLVFSASEYWSEKYSKKWNLRIIPLLQATNPDKFHLKEDSSPKSINLIFVGNTRGKFRKSVKIASEVSEDFKVIGSGWDKYISKDLILSKFIENEKLVDQYQDANIVLNDHWEDMAKFGFISNRLFDAVASGAKVISDEVPGISGIFGNNVKQFKTEDELRVMLKEVSDLDFGGEDSLKNKAREISLNHSFDVRIKTLLEEVRGLTTN